jgi:hypothetical protein
MSFQLFSRLFSRRFLDGRLNDGRPLWDVVTDIWDNVYTHHQRVQGEDAAESLWNEDLIENDWKETRQNHRGPQMGVMEGI